MSILAILNIYDDHEIKNDFEGRSNDFTYLFPNASSAFATYQGDANYHTYMDVNGRAANYFDFKYGDVAFFVLDTRRYGCSIHLDCSVFYERKGIDL